MYRMHLLKALEFKGTLKLLIFIKIYGENGQSWDRPKIDRLRNTGSGPINTVRVGSLTMVTCTVIFYLKPCFPLKHTGTGNILIMELLNKKYFV
jgi:hypothetical protein